MKTPALTITSNKKILLNAVAGDMLRQAGGKFVHILWDANACKLALKPLAEADRQSFTLTVGSGRKGMAITGRAVLRQIEWKSKKSEVIKAAWNKEAGVLEATLPKKLAGNN
jgi:hypothetical protein